MRKLKSPSDLTKLRESLEKKQDPQARAIVTTVGTCGLASGAGPVLKAIRREVKRQGLTPLRKA